MLSFNLIVCRENIVLKSRCSDNLLLKCRLFTHDLQSFILNYWSEYSFSSFRSSSVEVEVSNASKISLNTGLILIIAERP